MEEAEGGGLRVDRVEKVESRGERVEEVENRGVNLVQDLTVDKGNRKKG